MMLTATLIQNKISVKEIHTSYCFYMSFGMQKVLPPASSYDAASIIHTKPGNNIGIGI
jgi:hypothetical protein